MPSPQPGPRADARVRRPADTHAPLLDLQLFFSDTGPLARVIPGYKLRPQQLEMAQAVRRLGGEVALVEGADHVLAREPAPLGEALGEVLRRDGIELVLGARATAVRRAGEDYVLELGGGGELRGDRLLVATGRRPRVADIGLETVGIEAGYFWNDRFSGWTIGATISFSF